MKKVMINTVKGFVLGVLLVGGYFGFACTWGFTKYWDKFIWLCITCGLIAAEHTLFVKWFVKK